MWRRKNYNTSGINNLEKGRYQIAFFNFTSSLKCNNKCFDAKANLALCYSEGYGVQKNIPKAINYLIEIVQQIPSNLTNDGLPSYYFKALYLLHSIVRKNYATTSRNKSKLIYELEKLMRELASNSTEAYNDNTTLLIGQINYCISAFYSEHKADTDTPNFIKYLNDAADAGCVEALLDLAQFYSKISNNNSAREGLSTENALSKAELYYRRAADKGSIEAKYKLGKLLNAKANAITTMGMEIIKNSAASSRVFTTTQAAHFVISRKPTKSL